MMHISDEELMAYCDGELSSVAARELEQRLRDNPTLLKQVEAQRNLREKLHRCFDPVMQEQMPGRLTKLLEAPSEGNVLAFPWRQGRARSFLPKFAAIAATFAVGVLAGQLMIGDSSRLVVTGDPLMAQGDLYQVLETQLASEQRQDGRAKIGISFAAHDGKMCRSFETPAIAGLACKETEEWKLVLVTSAQGSLAGEYRQAGAPKIVMEAAQELMRGDALDGQAERQARDAGWPAATDAERSSNRGG
jgi:hypothetical protein